MTAVSFFISRRARCDEHSLLAHRAAESIRRLYPGAPITIVDDGSDPEFAASPSGATVVPNPFTGSGEAGAMKVARDSTDDPDGIVVVMHDSMVACERVDWDGVLRESGVAYLWTFPAVKWMEREAAMRLIDQSPPLTARLRETKLYDGENWTGCFGAAMAARRWALDKLHDGGVLSDDLISCVSTRGCRMGFERVVSLGTQIFVTEGGPPPSVCGSINDHPLPFHSIRPHAPSLRSMLLFRRLVRYSGAFMKTWHGR